MEPTTKTTTTEGRNRGLTTTNDRKKDENPAPAKDPKTTKETGHQHQPKKLTIVRDETPAPDKRPGQKENPAKEQGTQHQQKNKIRAKKDETGYDYKAVKILNVPGFHLSIFLLLRRTLVR
jgi:hypothetical protein